MQEVHHMQVYGELEGANDFGAGSQLNEMAVAVMQLPANVCGAVHQGQHQ